MKRIVAALLALCLISPAAMATDPVFIEVRVTTDSDPTDGLDDYVICACDGETQTLYAWATARPAEDYPDGVVVKHWSVGIVGWGVGDDVTYGQPVLDDYWAVEDAEWDDTGGYGGITWEHNYSGLMVRSRTTYPEGDRWQLLYSISVTVDADCDRGNETHTDAGGYFVSPHLLFIASIVKPGDPVRELTPNCNLDQVECPNRLPFCTQSAWCRDNYPDRNLTCGECEDLTDCPSHEQSCICGVCELYIE